MDGASWRALYALGLLPLVLVLFLRIAMRETRRFDAERARAATAPKRTWRDLAREAGLPWRRRVPAPLRDRRAALELGLHRDRPVDGVLGDLRARAARSSRPHQVGDIVFWGYGGGVARQLRRRLADRPDRPQVHLRGLLRARRDLDLPALPRAVGARAVPVDDHDRVLLRAANTATHVYASELFPDRDPRHRLRLDHEPGGARDGGATPIVIGLLIAPLGIPGAIAVVAAGPILGALLVLRYAPETRGLTLEQIATPSFHSLLYLRAEARKAGS